ncbi:MAG: hypothetical protein KatS3mg128_0325 [Silanimonas sp.]|nr:MAG: hypothetical protein KatS3mg128_0325 [Silanimonas sp.]
MPRQGVLADAHAPSTEEATPLPPGQAGPHDAPDQAVQAHGLALAAGKSVYGGRPQVASQERPPINAAQQRAAATLFRLQLSPHLAHPVGRPVLLAKPGRSRVPGPAPDASGAFHASSATRADDVPPPCPRMASCPRAGPAPSTTAATMMPPRPGPPTLHPARRATAWPAPAAANSGLRKRAAGRGRPTAYRAGHPAGPGHPHGGKARPACWSRALARRINWAARSRRLISAGPRSRPCRRRP